MSIGEGFAIFCGISGFILLVLGIYKLINYFINFYPTETIEIDITKKKNMNNDELLDFYLINNGTSKVERHIKEINDWKKEKLDKMNEKKSKKFLDKCNRNCYKAFTFKGVRTQTRYKQVNYQRYGYQVNVVSNNFYASEEFVLNRINFLKSHNYSITYNNYNKSDQRKALTKELRQKIIQRDRYTCQQCGKYMPDEVGLQIDHIIPISQGGKSIEKNLRVLCSKCNGKKGSKLDSDPNLSNKINENFIYDKYGNRDTKILRKISDYQKEFYDEYFNLEYDKMEKTIYSILNIEPLVPEEKNSLHFCILGIADLVYSLREKKDSFEDLAILLCKKDFANFETLSQTLKGCVVGTLTRLCIIYEKNIQYKDAIDLCDLGIKYSFADSGKKNFIFRKERLLKKL